MKLQILLVALGCSIGGAVQLTCFHYLNRFPQLEVIDTSTRRGKLQFSKRKLLLRLSKRGLLDGCLVGMGSSSILLLTKKSNRRKLFALINDANILNKNLEPVLLEPLPVLPWYKKFLGFVYKTRKVYKVVLVLFFLVNYLEAVSDPDFTRKTLGVAIKSLDKTIALTEWMIHYLELLIL